MTIVVTRQVSRNKPLKTDEAGPRSPPLFFRYDISHVGEMEHMRAVLESGTFPKMYSTPPIYP